MTITTKRSMKLYDGLTSKQKAALAINIIANTQNYDECERICNTVPRFTYRAADHEFISWREGLIDAMALASMELWKLEVWKWRLTAATAMQDHADMVRFQNDIPLDEDQGVELIELTRRNSRKQSALVEAFRQAVGGHGVEFDTWLSFAGYPADDLPKCEPCPDWLEQFNETLASLLPDRKTI